MNTDRRPWLGLASFTEAHAAQFFGREAEVAELVRRLSRKGLTVLFGQSGLGKTSMLQAGVVPRLREAGFAPVLVRMDYAAEAPSPATQMLGTLGWSQDEGLWEQLHRRDRTGPAQLLIFDQFEEVFTLGQANEAGRAKAADFLAQLADLVENRVPASLEARLEEDDTLFERYDLQRGDFRLLISLREDYLAHLEPLKANMPSITQNRMRIGPMAGEQALQAVCGPGGELVSTDTAEAIVCFVSGAKSVQNAEVEPALLSLILRELNEQRIARGQAQITPDLLAGSHVAILSDFYERSLADQPAGVRNFIEDQLLTDTGYRENVAEERVQQAFSAAGAGPGALAQLVNRRLLRVEERLDRRRVELTHDTLCTVVATSRDSRRERERVEAAERQAAEQLAHARRARVAVLRARWVAGISATLGLAAIVASGLAYRYFSLANEARGSSQALTAYLLDDFAAELEPAGRLDIVVQLAQRAIGYYEALPEALRNDDSRRQEALARIQKGNALIRQFRANDGRPEIEKALAVLDRLLLRRSDDRDLLFLKAQALQGLSHLSYVDVRYADGLQQARESEALLKPLGAPRTARELDTRLTSLGFVTSTESIAGDKQAALQAARDFLALAGAHGAGVGGRNPRVTTRLLNYSSGMLRSLRQAGQQAEADALLDLLNERTEWLLSVQGDHPDALSVRAVLRLIAAAKLRETHQNQAAMVLYASATADLERVVERDPQNGYSVGDLSRSLREVADTQVALGRMEQALETLRRADRAAAALPDVAQTLLIRIEARFALSAYEMQLGQTDSVRSRLRELRALAARVPGARGLLAHYSASRLEAWLAIQEGRMSDGEVLLRDAWATLQARLPATGTLTPQNRRRLQSSEVAGLGLLCEAALRRRATTEAVAECQAALKSAQTQGDEESILHRRYWLALALARAGQRDLAAQTLAPAVQHYEALAKRLHDDEEVHLEHGRVLLVQALTELAQRRVHLQRARQIYDALPPEFRRIYNYRMWNDWINDEIAKR